VAVLPSICNNCIMKH